MSVRRILSVLSWACVLAFALLILSPVVFQAAPQDSGYRVLRTIPLGGEGGWDYVTVDSAARRVYIPRSTHILVIDADSGKQVADIQGMNGLHGVAVAPEFNRGFVTGNKTEQEGTVYVFDLKTMMLTSSIKSNSIDTDSLLYDPSTKRVYVNNGDGMNLTVVDAATAKVAGAMPFNANPEAAAADGKGSIFQDYEDKGQVIEYDAMKLTIKNKWPTPGCDAPVAMAMDKMNRRLYIGCRGKGATAPGVMIVMNADNGKVVASMPIAIGVDGDVFDPASGDVFATCRDSGDGKTGATYIFHADSPDKISLVATVKTIYGARTVALDSKTHHIFSIGTEKNDPVPPTAKNPNPRPKPVLSTFELLEIGK
ncbi:MAG TPA: YncE family protein [Verrucomicrobiae bacterium]|nr:YncE family protein [Verrucomicrobiae bacterium]